MKKIYFAHPVNIYSQPLEIAFEKLIACQLASGRLDLIENPNQPHHQVGYDNYSKRKKESGLNHKGMSYFYDEVLPNCGGCAAAPFLDNKFGLGVAGEMQWFLRNNKPVWCIWNTDLLWACMDSDLFIKNPLGGLFEINLVPESGELRNLILANDTNVIVPHEETRLRTWRIYNREKRPYEEAHLVKMPIPEGFYPEG